MKRLKTLIKKEIMDILRDRKTLIIMVVVPLLLYPTLIIGMTLGMSMFMQAQEEKVHTVGYEGSAAETEVVAALQKLYEENKEDLVCELEFKQMEAGTIAEEDENSADVWLTVREDETGNLVAEIAYTSTEQDSDYAESALSELLDIYKEDLLAEKLAKEGLTEKFLHPVIIESVDSATQSESFGMSIGGSIGMMLIVTILMAAFYPAVDVTTGEKERGTLETLLTLPVSNFQMIMSKYIAVALFASVTAVLSLVALGGSVLFLMFGISTEMLGEFSTMDPGFLLALVPVLLVAMITTALLITAVCMCFCVFAKSMKEANNYSTPVMLVIMFASMVAMIPTVELDYRTALIPFVNVSLLIKQIIAQQFSMSLAGITIVINLAYSILIIWILAKMYDSEDILFHDGFRSFNLFKKRSEMEKGTMPAVGDLIIGVVIVLLLTLYLGTAVAVRSAFAGTVTTQLIILSVPLLLIWYLKSDARKLLSLQKPKKGSIPGSLFFYVGMYCLGMAATGILVELFPASTENMNAAYDVMLQQPAVLIVLVMAVMPAVGEEILFRGFLCGGFRHRYGVTWGIVISSLIFGAFHMSLVKLIPTAILGACFAYILSVSGSIYIGMALHFINNAFSLLLMKYPETIGKIAPILMKEHYLAGELLIFLATGLVCSGLGIWMLGKSAKVPD